jgi:hypothetical protein
MGFSHLQVERNRCLGGYRPQILLLSALCPQLNLLNPPSRTKFLGTPLFLSNKNRANILCFLTQGTLFCGKTLISPKILGSLEGAENLAPTGTFFFFFDKDHVYSSITRYTYRHRRPAIAPSTQEKETKTKWTRSPDRPARSQSLYQLSYPTHKHTN